jgi:hypothetical protein
MSAFLVAKPDASGNGDWYPLYAIARCSNSKTLIDSKMRAKRRLAAGVTARIATGKGDIRMP